MTYWIYGYDQHGNEVAMVHWGALPTKTKDIDFRQMHGHTGKVVALKCAQSIKILEEFYKISIRFTSGHTFNQEAVSGYITSRLLPLLVAATLNPDARFYGDDCNMNDSEIFDGEVSMSEDEYFKMS